MKKQSELERLRGVGGFVSKEAVRKEVKFKGDDGEEYTAIIHVRKLSIGDYEQLHAEAKDGRFTNSYAISRAVTLGENGDEPISQDVAESLSLSLGTALYEAFAEVNGTRPKS